LIINFDLTREESKIRFSFDSLLKKIYKNKAMIYKSLPL
jgi:hypothetical protein